MKLFTSARLQCASCLLSMLLLPSLDALAAPQVLVSERFSAAGAGSRILRYDANGNFLGVLIDDPVNLQQPYGMALSPDRTKLYVGSQQTNSVVRYDFDGTTASSPTVVVSSNISVPTSLHFSANGQTLYVSNLGFGFDGDTVSQFDPNGAYLGALTGGPPTGRTGLALDSAGNLLVGTFSDSSVSQTDLETVLKYNSGTQEFEPFIGPDAALHGTANLLVHEGDLFVVDSDYLAQTPLATVRKFDATTGVKDLSFNAISVNEFPGGLTLAPDGSGFLLSFLELGVANSRIERYSFDGAYLGLFANNSGGDPNFGFLEATGLLTIFDSADFDTDGDVDDADLSTWETAYGVDNEADADGDDDSDGNDFLAWQQQFTGDLGPLSFPATAVPEPSSSLLLCLGALVFGRYRRPFRPRSRNLR